MRCRTYSASLSLKAKVLDFIKSGTPDGESTHQFDSTEAISVELTLSEGVTIWLRDGEADSEDSTHKWHYWHIYER